MPKFYLCLLKLTSLSHGKLFLRYFRQLFISLALGKCKNDCNILKVILAKVFCPLKTEKYSFDFLPDFFPIRFYCMHVYKRKGVSKSKGVYFTFVIPFSPLCCLGIVYVL